MDMINLNEHRQNNQISGYILIPAPFSRLHSVGTKAYTNYEIGSKTLRRR
jgi:hypothetical protein